MTLSACSISNNFHFVQLRNSLRLLGGAAFTTPREVKLPPLHWRSTVLLTTRDLRRLEAPNSKTFLVPCRFASVILQSLRPHCDTRSLTFSTSI